MEEGKLRKLIEDVRHEAEKNDITFERVVQLLEESFGKSIAKKDAMKNLEEEFRKKVNRYIRIELGMTEDLEYYNFTIELIMISYSLRGKSYDMKTLINEYAIRHQKDESTVAIRVYSVIDNIKKILKKKDESDILKAPNSRAMMEMMISEIELYKTLS